MEIDTIVAESLAQLAEDEHVRTWAAKEQDWVNYFAFNHLLRWCRPNSVLHDPAQIGIEGLVPQPPGYTRLTAGRDLVIWPVGGMTCWSDDWRALYHPLAVLEWKVHRPNRRNRQVMKERTWLRKYCAWQPEVVAYAVEVIWSPEHVSIECVRFRGKNSKERWWVYDSHGLS